jgi:hypothetical protein
MIHNVLRHLIRSMGLGSSVDKFGDDFMWVMEDYPIKKGVSPRLIPDSRRRELLSPRFRCPETAFQSDWSITSTIRDPISVRLNDEQVDIGVRSGRSAGK